MKDTLNRRLSIRRLTVQEQTIYRPRTFLEKQPFILGYGAAISIVSPAATAYQLCKLYNVKQSLPHLFKLSLRIFPHQTALKALQMNVSTPFKEYLNPWVAFGIVGILQGGVYGQCNVYFSNALKIGKQTASMAGIFRGSGFAGLRDTVSQGLPFMCSGMVKDELFERLYKTENENVQLVQHWSAVLGTSVVATYMSQGLHNCQIAMQSNQSLGYVAAIHDVYQKHGFKMLYRGAEARVGLLLVVNILNELLLKPAWAPVAIDC